MSMISGLLEYLRGDTKKTAVIAKERLQIILAHERAGRGGATPDYLPALQEELLMVIAKYIHVDRELIKVQLEKHGEYEVLELNITLPENAHNS
ncbi:MAG: cell division topological specificity factor MinE [Sulfuricella sp.]|nr:cell division topological specificity factor MinE [Sulfuricella sp.]